MYFSTEIALIAFETKYPSIFFFDGFIKTPKKKQKLTINKSPHVFKKSKERFIAFKPDKITYVTPYFSSHLLLKFYIKSILKSLYIFSFSNRIKIKIIISSFLLLNGWYGVK